MFRRILFAAFAATLPIAVDTDRVSAALIAGVDFSNASVFGGSGGSFSITPDDLNLSDGIVVSSWSFSGGGTIIADANSDVGRASAPIGKMDGVNGGTQPTVGDTPPTANVHAFSITIPNTLNVTLTDITFDFSAATDSTGRWLAFRTSLDSTLTYSQQGVARPGFTAANINVSDPKFQGLTNQTVTFYWYAGGPGTGDIDIDNILIQGNVTPVPEPATLVLFALGTIALAEAGRRRRAAR